MDNGFLSCCTSIFRRTLIRTLETLDAIWSIDHAIIRLVLNMHKDTHVLVSAQARVRSRVSDKLNAHKHKTLDVPNIEWSESLFLAKVKRLWQLKVNDDDKLMHKDVFEIFYGKSLQDNHRYHLLRKTYSSLGKFGAFYPSQAVSSGVLKKQSLQENVEKGETSISSFGLESLWFWDTTLPFNLAAINDCETLYSHDPVTAQLLRSVSIYNSYDVAYIYI